MFIYRKFHAIYLEGKMTRITGDMMPARDSEVGITDELIGPVDRENIPSSTVWVCPLWKDYGWRQPNDLIEVYGRLPTDDIRHILNAILK